MPLGKLSKNLAWLFLAGFMVLVVLEGIEINNSVQIILNSNQEPPLVNPEKGVRINFDNYDAVVNRIQSASSFVPTDGVFYDPFHGNGQKTNVIIKTPLLPAFATTSPTTTTGN